MVLVSARTKRATALPQQHAQVTRGNIVTKLSTQAPALGCACIACFAVRTPKPDTATKAVCHLLHG